MSIEEKLKELIVSRYKSVRKFTQAKNLPYSSVDSILRRGIKNSSLTNIFKLCHALNINVDELANDKIVPDNQVVKTTARINDIDDIINLFKRNIKENKELTIDGVILKDSEKRIILNAIDIAIGIIRRERYEKL